MRVISAQGVVLDGVDRRVPGSTSSMSIEVFDPGLHHLIWSQSSAVQVRTPRVELLVASPHGLWIPAGHPYEVEGSTAWWTARFVADSCSPSWQRIVHLELGDVVAPMLTHLAHHPSSEWSTELLSAVVAHLRDAFVARAGSLPFPVDPRAREVADGVVADPSSVMELGDWAPRVGASERTLRRLFAEQTGMSFRAWRSQLRVHTAMRLLGDGVPVAEVARRCGYRSREALDKTFTAHTGITPAQYARRGDAGPSSEVAWPSSSRSWPPGSKSSSEPLVDLLRNLTGDEMTGWSRKLGLLGSAMVLIAAACGSDDDSADDAVGAGEVAEVDETEQSAAEEGGADGALEPAFDPSALELDGWPTLDEQPPFFEILDRDDETVTLEHAYGEIVIPRNPQRIVAAYASAEALITLGIEPIAYPAWTEPSPVLQERAPEMVWLPIVDGSPNLEEIAALEPDLIIDHQGWMGGAGEGGNHTVVSQIAPTLVPKSIPLYWQDYLLELGEIFDLDDRAEAAVADYSTRVDSFRARVRAEVGPGETITPLLFFGDEPWLHTPISTFDGRNGRDPSVAWIYSELGLTPGPWMAEVYAQGGEEPGYTPVSEELLGEIRADHLAVFPAGYGYDESIPEEYVSFTEGTPLWSFIPAVESDNVHELVGVGEVLGYHTILNALEIFTETVER
ncbi:MAG: helix-turn-helix domain-containing protein [Actinomycetota bacterium]